MNTARWQQVKKIFEAALEHAPAQRTAFLNYACAGDATIRQEVESLLASHDEAPDFTDTAAATATAGELSGDAAKLSAGQRFGHFEIVSLLGAGGMGEVYLAHDSRLNRKIALKLLPSYFTDDAEQVRRFEREARAASALNHHNILIIHEIGRDDGRHFIATEFVEGETLRRRMERAAKLQFVEALDVATQIASALTAAHAAGVVHRDIKPENVMLRRDGFVKVLDFGLAKLIEKKELSPNTEAKTKLLLQTTPGLVMGTPSYMSPEQARGQAVDARTDIFSLGVVLYEMLAGRLPFAGETVTDLLVAILHDEPPSLLIHRQDTPAELARIVTKTLRKDRDERYQTAKDLLIDLKSLQKRLEFDAELERTSPANKQTEAKTQIFKAEAQTSIAVLPFTNMSADAENEYFCDGLAEELLNALAKIEDLKVAARTSAFSFKGKNTNVSEIGGALNVKTVLEGSVRKSGNHLRITVQLVNSSDGYHLWSERYDREMKDIFDVQDEITLAIVDALKVKLFGEEKAAVLKRYTNNLEAYQLFLKGRYHWYKQTPENVRKSRDYFQQAIDIDPAYAPGYAGLSEFYGISSALGMMPPNEGWPKAEAAMMKAQELDDTLPEVHNGLEAIRMFYYRDWDGAKREIERTIQLNPNFAEVYHLHSFCLTARGRLDDAIAEMHRALELDPLSLTYHHSLGNWFYYSRQYDEAIGKYHQALELDANNASVYEELGNIYEQKEMNDEAVAAWRQAMMLAGDNEIALILDTAYAEGGFASALREVAEKRLEQLNARSKSGEYVPAIKFARLYIRLGDKEQAFRLLEKACEERNSFPFYISLDPFYDGLRSDSRYQDILRRFGLTTDETTHGASPNKASEARTVLLAPATTDAKETTIADTNIANEQMHEHKPKARQTWLLITLLSLLIAAAGFFSYRSFTSDASKQIESIAVLPFINESGNADVEYLSDGMTDSLINSLSQLPKLSVKARSSVFRYKGKAAEAKQVGADLNVQGVLNGRVIQRGDDLTLSLSLDSVQTGNQIWGKQYNRKISNLIALQSEIARDVSNSLQTKLSGADAQKLAKNYTENVEAYQLYLRGRFYTNKRTPKDSQKAIEYFNQAIAADPKYALAFAGLADAYSILSSFGGAPSHEAMPKAREAVLKALSLDNNLAEAHAALGLILSSYDYDFAGAEREFRRAIELNPNYATAHHYYAQLLNNLSRFEEASAEYRRALEIDPLSLIINRHYGESLFFARRYDAGLAQLKKTVELDANFASVYASLALLYQVKGNYAESVEAQAREQELFGNTANAALIRESFARGGWKEFLRVVTEAPEPILSPWHNAAAFHAELGNKDKAFAELNKAYENRKSYVTLLKVDPRLDPLRDDPRFQELLRRVGFPQ